MGWDDKKAPAGSPAPVKYGVCSATYLYLAEDPEPFALAEA